MTVSVAGGIAISGSFQQANGSPKTPVASQINTPMGTGGAVCECRNAAGNVSTTSCESYSCTVPANWTGSIAFSSSQSYSFCRTNNGSTGTPCTALSGGVWDLVATGQAPVTTSITQDIYVWRP